MLLVGLNDGCVRPAFVKIDRVPPVQAEVSGKDSLSGLADLIYSYKQVIDQ